MAKKKIAEKNNSGPIEIKSKIWRVWAGMISFFAIAATIFGTLADGKEVVSGCNQKVSTQKKKIDPQTIKFKKITGRWGSSFKYPEDWEVQMAEDFASMGKEILHPTNPEIGISYIDIFYPVYSDNSREYSSDFREVIEAERKILQKQGLKITAETTVEKTYNNCKVNYGKLTFLCQSNHNSKIDKIGIKMFTYLDNQVFFELQVFCPVEDYEVYEDLLQIILSSIEFDCDKMSKEY